MIDDRTRRHQPQQQEEKCEVNSDEWMVGCGFTLDWRYDSVIYIVSWFVAVHQPFHPFLRLTSSLFFFLPVELHPPLPPRNWGTLLWRWIHTIIGGGQPMVYAGFSRRDNVRKEGEVVKCPPLPLSCRVPGLQQRVNIHTCGGITTAAAFIHSHTLIAMCWCACDHQQQEDIYIARLPSHLQHDCCTCQLSRQLQQYAFLCTNVASIVYCYSESGALRAPASRPQQWCGNKPYNRSVGTCIIMYFTCSRKKLPGINKVEGRRRYRHQVYYLSIGSAHTIFFDTELRVLYVYNMCIIDGVVCPGRMGDVIRYCMNVSIPVWMLLYWWHIFPYSYYLHSG